MSAIVGVYNRNGQPIDRSLIGSMLDSVSGYGPEGRRIVMAGHIGLGHAMMVYTPESRYETLPAWHDNLLITFDGRIDNRPELANQLSLDLRHSMMPDSHIVIQAYRKWGRECPRYLIGDFAFAIWDATEQELFCATDHLGVRCFYYVLRNDFIAFATDVRALWQHPDIYMLPNEPAVIIHLERPSNLFQHHTLYKEVTPLTFGYGLTVNSYTASKTKYWEPFADSGSPIHYPQSEDYAAHLRELMERAISDRLRTDYPVGSHISGGLDSTSITVYAARCSSQLAMSYSWSPPRSPRFPRYQLNDERDRIDEIAALYALPVHYLETSPDLFDRYVKRSPIIGWSPNYAEEQEVAQLAGQAGIRMILSGYGGDHAASLSGHVYLSELLLRRQFRECLRLLNKIPPERRSSAIVRMVKTLLPDPIYRLLGFDETTGLTYLNSTFKQRIKIEKSLYPSLSRPKPTIREMLHYMLHEGAMYELSATWIHAAADTGVQYSFPLMDRRVLEFIYRLPSHLFLKGETNRYVFRQSLRGVLPDHFLQSRAKLESALNERRRWQRGGYWQMLIEQVKRGEWDDIARCEWIDGPRLRNHILSIPTKFQNGDVPSLWRIIKALEMTHLWQVTHKTAAPH